MGNFFRRIRNILLPKKSEVNVVLSSFSKKEWIVFSSLVAIFIISSLLLLHSANKSFMTLIPFHGGELSEGIVGSPRFVNPVLAFSDTDRDIVSLIYSGLMRKDGDGKLIPDLAESYEMSTDGKTYTFILRDGLKFHDDSPLTVDDVIFTIAQTKEAIIQSPRKADFDGVAVEKVDDKTIKFTMSQPHASFLENLTIGIMPKALWENSPIELSDLNTSPIGSGPYMISNSSKEAYGIIDSYELTSFKDFTLNAPYIKKVILRFYPNETDLIRALKNDEVSQVSSITPENAIELADAGYNVETSVLPRVFGLFFNQNQNQIFTNKVVVKAINDVINKDRIIDEVLHSYGVAISEPVPPNMLNYTKAALISTTPASREDIIKKVQENLAKDGWKVGASGFLEKTATVDKKKVTSVLEFSISTGNAPELARSAELIKEDLTAVGMKVDVKTFEVGNLNQSIIRPRKYDALLFGQIINNESDLYAFWHSSQRKDPGLNISQYTNAKVDKILEEAFTTIDAEARAKKYTQFEDEIRKDMPAVFLYSPNFIYVVNNKLKGLNMAHIAFPSDRFANVYNWYTETDNVWKIFAKDNTN